ncbi:MAG: hypothetical protein WCR19_02760 [Acholeplasmataceae bacterium]
MAIGSPREYDEKVYLMGDIGDMKFADQVIIKPSKASDTTSPVLSGKTVFITAVDDPYTKAENRVLISAYDETDDDITQLIVIESDGYYVNRTAVGSFEIEYSVTDGACNTSYQKR